MKLDLQVFNGISEKPRDKIEIKKDQLLGKGAQAEVYQITLKHAPGQQFVDKTKKIKNNKIYADRELRNMFAEFCIAKDLDHPNIVQYKYFMRNYEK